MNEQTQILLVLVAVVVPLLLAGVAGQVLSATRLARIETKLEPLWEEWKGKHMTEKKIEVENG